MNDRLEVRMCKHHVILFKKLVLHSTKHSYICKIRMNKLNSFIGSRTNEKKLNYMPYYWLLPFPFSP